MIGGPIVNIFKAMLKVYCIYPSESRCGKNKDGWVADDDTSPDIYNAQALNKLHYTNICISIGFFLEMCGMGSPHQAT